MPNERFKSFASVRYCAHQVYFGKHGITSYLLQLFKITNLHHIFGSLVHFIKSKSHEVVYFVLWITFLSYVKLFEEIAKLDLSYLNIYIVLISEVNKKIVLMCCFFLHMLQVSCAKLPFLTSSGNIW